jgi:hypothetical protein
LKIIANQRLLREPGYTEESVAKWRITEIYHIKSGEVGKAITRVPAKASYGGNRSRLYTVLYAKGSRMGLYKFGSLPKEPPSQKGVPVAKR